jgi:hypothetical protein
LGITLAPEMAATSRDSAGYRLWSGNIPTDGGISECTAMSPAQLKGFVNWLRQKVRVEDLLGRHGEKRLAVKTRSGAGSASVMTDNHRFAIRSH